MVDWERVADRSTPLAFARLAAELDVSSGCGLIVSVSHEDYAGNLGGVQILIDDEQRAFARAGWRYLHVSPASPLPILADLVRAAEFRVGLRLDGEWLGVASFSDLLDAISGCRNQGADIEVIFHHFLGHVPELALELVRAGGAVRPIVWVHDFFTLCPSYALLRNDVAYCGAPHPDSTACWICSYGEERKPHVERMHVFFKSAQPVVLVPSDAARDLWQRRSNLPYAEATVVPHARLLTAPSGRPRKPPGASTPLRIAHLGSRLFHKGWQVFEELARLFVEDDRYQFFQLGSKAGPNLPENIRNIPVGVSGKQRFAMVEAVAEARIDVAVNWSLCFETFSFSTFEALAGGACVVTRGNAGNVWPAIEANAPGQGCTVADEAALFALFAGEGLQAMVDSAPLRRGALIPQGGTARSLLTRRRVSESILHPARPAA